MPVENNITIQATANINVGGGGTTAPTPGSPRTQRPTLSPAERYELAEKRRAELAEYIVKTRLDEKNALDQIVAKELRATDIERRREFAARKLSYNLLAMQMTLLGINFSTMMFVSSLHKAGILTEEQYKTWTQIQGVMSAVLSLAQMILAIEQLITIEKIQQAIASITEKGFLAPLAAAAAIVGAGMLIAYFSGAFNQVKKAAKGAYVPATPGGMMFVVGEGGQNEVISPEPMLRQIVREESGSKIIIYAMDSEDVIRGLKRAKMEMDLRGDRIW